MRCGGQRKATHAAYSTQRFYPCYLAVASLASAASVAYLLAYFACIACVIKVRKGLNLRPIYVTVVLKLMINFGYVITAV